MAERTNECFTKTLEYNIKWWYKLKNLNRNCYPAAAASSSRFRVRGCESLIDEPKRVRKTLKNPFGTVWATSYVAFLPCRWAEEAFLHRKTAVAKKILLSLRIIEDSDHERYCFWIDTSYPGHEFLWNMRETDTASILKALLCKNDASSPSTFHASRKHCGDGLALVVVAIKISTSIFYVFETRLATVILSDQ